MDELKQEDGVCKGDEVVDEDTAVEADGKEERGGGDRDGLQKPITCEGHRLGELWEWGDLGRCRNGVRNELGVAGQW